MKVVRFETFPLSIPYRHTERSARVTRDGVSDVIVKLTADDGTIGWGESCSGADIRSIESALHAMSAYVIGRSPWDLDQIAQDVFAKGLQDYHPRAAPLPLPASTWRFGTFAASKAASRWSGSSAVRCAGGIGLFNYLSGDAKSLDAECRSGVRKAIPASTSRSGIDDAAEEGKIETIRSAIGPGRKIRIDANEAWSVAKTSLSQPMARSVRPRFRRGPRSCSSRRDETAARAGTG